MDENGNTVTFDGNQVAGQPLEQNVQSEQIQSEAPGQSPANQNQLDNLTKEEVLQLIEKTREDVMTEAERWMQSQFDKRDNRLEKRIEAIQEQAKTLGLSNDDPAVQQKIMDERRRALDEAFDAKGNTGQPKAQQDAPANPLDGYVRARQQQIFTELGEMVTDNDPEAQSIQRDSLENFLYTYRKAVEAKKQRRDQETRTPGSPESRMGSLGSGGIPGNPIAEIRDPHELFKIAFGKR